VTGKAKRDLATGKAQGVKLSCEHCADGAMPYRLKVTLSGFGDCACYPAGAYGSEDVGIGAVNGDWLIPHIGSACQYYKNFAGDFGEWKLYFDEACADWKSTNDFTHLIISVDLKATGIYVYIQLTMGPPGGGDVPLFKGTIPYREGESCGQGSDGVDNELVSCDTMYGSGGHAVVERA